MDLRPSITLLSSRDFANTFFASMPRDLLPPLLSFVTPPPPPVVPCRLRGCDYAASDFVFDHSHPITKPCIDGKSRYFCCIANYDPVIVATTKYSLCLWCGNRSPSYFRVTLSNQHMCRECCDVRKGASEKMLPRSLEFGGGGFMPDFVRRHARERGDPILWDRPEFAEKEDE